MNVKLQTEHHLEFLSLTTGGYRGSSECTLVKMPHCWKSHTVAQLSHRDITHDLHHHKYPTNQISPSYHNYHENPNKNITTIENGSPNNILLSKKC